MNELLTFDDPDIDGANNQQLWGDYPQFRFLSDLSYTIHIHAYICVPSIHMHIYAHACMYMHTHTYTRMYIHI